MVQIWFKLFVVMRICVNRIIARRIAESADINMNRFEPCEPIVSVIVFVILHNICVFGWHSHQY